MRVMSAKSEGRGIIGRKREVVTMCARAEATMRIDGPDLTSVRPSSRSICKVSASLTHWGLHRN